MIPDDLADLAIPIDSVRPFPGNAREGDIGAICTSLEANSQYRPIVVNRREGTEFGGGTILAGNHTWQAAAALGWQEIAATFVDVDDDTAKRIVLVDNRSNDLASYDDDALIELLADITQEHGPGGLLGTGFDDDDLDQLLRFQQQDGSQVDPQAEWDAAGMPDYEQSDLNSAAHVVVHFPTEEDAERFFKLMKRPRVKTMWWPDTDGHKGATVKEEWVSADA